MQELLPSNCILCTSNSVQLLRSSAAAKKPKGATSSWQRNCEWLGICCGHLVPHQPHGKTEVHHCYWDTADNILVVLRLALLVTGCAHSGHADMDPAVANAEEESRSRAISFLCASAFQLYELQPGKACC